MSGADLAKADPQDAVLVALMRGPKRGMTVAELREQTGRAASTVRNNIAVVADTRWGGVSRFGGAWVEVVPDSQPVRYRLTEKGREVARFRGRRLR